MAAPAMQAIANITLSASSATVTFSNIPQTYRDLRLIVNAYCPGGDNSIIRFNGDSGVNYASVSMSGNGSTTTSGATSYSEIYVSTMGTAMITGIAEIFDYAQTDRHKTVLTRGNDTTAYIMARANRWTNTAAITSIAVTCSSSYSVGSTFTLYGVLA